MSNGGGGSGGGGNDSGIGDRTYTYAIGSNHNQYKKNFKKKNRVPRAQTTGLASSGPVFGHC